MPDASFFVVVCMPTILASISLPSGTLKFVVGVARCQRLAVLDEDAFFVRRRYDFPNDEARSQDRPYLTRERCTPSSRRTFDWQIGYSDSRSGFTRLEGRALSDLHIVGKILCLDV